MKRLTLPVVITLVLMLLASGAVAASVVRVNTLTAQVRDGEAKLKEKDTQAESVIVLNSFVQKHGTKVALERITKPSQIYVAYWRDDKVAHVSLLVDGIWVEIAQAPIVPPVPEKLPDKP